VAIYEQIPNTLSLSQQQCVRYLSGTGLTGFEPYFQCSDGDDENKVTGLFEFPPQNSSSCSEIFCRNLVRSSLEEEELARNF